MTRLLKILQRIFLDTLGGVATSSLLVCSISGILLAVPYSVDKPLASLTLMMLDNPAGVFIRNIHYWSAQFLLVFTFLHLLDHFIRSTEHDVSSGVWIRVTLSVPVLFFVMISGFILKGDPDALSAYSILASLLEKIPLLGSLLRNTFLGSENNLELIYVHHVSTATIIIFLVLYEHARKLWPSAAGFSILLFILLLLGYFLNAPLGGESGKGPWYFVGFQEILHWLSHPGFAWLLILLPLLLIMLIRWSGIHWTILLKKILLVIFIGYTLTTLTGAFFRGENWKWQWPWHENKMKPDGIYFRPLLLKTAEDFDFHENIPMIDNRAEGCLVCHDNVTGLVDAHDPAVLGCYSCHLGNPFTLDKKRAHKDMALIPGNLDNAAKTCGTARCHPGIIGRVNNSIMTSMSGVVSVDRFVFGEVPTPDEPAHIRDIGFSAADQHLRDLCANCHLGNPKTESGPVNSMSRGGGCNACHLNYSDSARVSLTLAEARLNKGVYYHPQLNLNVSDNHCFGCHSRSGRIALNYEGWHETLLEKEDIPPEGKFKVLDDQRVVEYIRDDVHHQAGMSCIDCHTSYELMGDGNLYAHKEQQVIIRCEDCHFFESPGTLNYQQLDNESKKIIAQRKWPAEGLHYLAGLNNGHALVNAWFDAAGQPVLRIKNGDTLLPLNPPVEACRQGAVHQSLSCESCHTSWVPQCIGCHNVFDKKAPGFDMLEYRERTGSWVEHVALFMADTPPLGIIEQEDGSKQVRTFTPGMILSIDTASFKTGKEGANPIFRRLYAPASAHTTVREGRSCSSCHLDPLAIGYGRGKLDYQVADGAGTWILQSRFALNPVDRLPEDAWIGFLSEPEGVLSTRTNARPFSLKEQRAILTAGSCLVCHEEDSEVIRQTLENFPAVLKRVSRKCVLPRWD